MLYKVSSITVKKLLGSGGEELRVMRIISPILNAQCPISIKFEKNSR
jgi:hypothetical protein